MTRLFFSILLLFFLSFSSVLSYGQSTVFLENFDNSSVPGFQFTNCYGGGQHNNSAFIVSGMHHGWFNVKNGISNAVVYERKFTVFNQVNNIELEYLVACNSSNAPMELTVSNQHGAVVYFEIFTPQLNSYKLMKHSIPSGSATEYKISFRALFTGGNMMDIIMEDLHVRQDLVLSQEDIRQFDVKQNENDILLQWRIAPNPDLAHIELERSRDAVDFESIHTEVVNFAVENHQFSDNVSTSGDYYYRLKLVYKDGSFFYSKLKAVNISNRSNTLKVSPNPFHDELRIDKGGLSDDFELSIINTLGQKVWGQQYVEEGNILQLSLPKDLPKGIYYLVFNGGESIQMKRIVKRN